MRVYCALKSFILHSKLSQPTRYMGTTKIFAISDLHVDYKENAEFVNSWDASKYVEDVLLVAGDVTDKVHLLSATLKELRTKYKEVFYVPGNHELWIRPPDTVTDSVTKFHQILSLCDDLGVHYKPKEIHGISGSSESVWIFPLFSWYSKPEDDPEDSLSSHSNIQDLEFSEQIWMDNHLCKWSKLCADQSPAYFFSCINEQMINSFKNDSKKSVITFSHFLPRFELIRSMDSDKEAVNKERLALGLEVLDETTTSYQGSVKGFNFARYAGSKSIEAQLREVGSCVHVHGHQHRNRDRVIDGVRYVSHCLGGPREQKDGWVWGVREWGGPKQIWPPV